ERLRLRRAYKIAGADHVERRLGADEPRQALRAARAGNDPELHLRQAHLRRRQRHAVMAAERHFEAAAERGAVDRGDGGLARGLEAGDYEIEVGRLERLPELLDVGAG